MRCCRKIVLTLNTKQFHRVRNERKLIGDETERLKKMQNGREGNEAILLELQDTLFPDRVGQSIDHKSLAKALRTMASLCETKGDLDGLDESNVVEIGATRRSRKKSEIGLFDFVKV